VVLALSLLFVTGADFVFLPVDKIGEWSSRSCSLGLLLETETRGEHKSSESEMIFRPSEYL
jgi:hypothetical protein